ncbi:hypothetical protein EJB05_22239 [Eragrostis curvula]|uniref:Serine-threonine/tyrosine-protein kinase catalytic domain-containing protein n=1 Tax=Eragrostis curvula TaxID=38414 RepID=A0A5J9V388_9POAL|nr:hypothetical protein EJB05_22239 [Eragrostis curvula]
MGNCLVSTNVKPETPKIQSPSERDRSDERKLPSNPGEVEALRRGASLTGGVDDLPPTRAVQKTAMLAYHCLNRNPKARPLMRDVVASLEPLQQPPEEPAPAAAAL